MSKDLDKLVLNLDKMFGKGTLNRLGDKPRVDIAKFTSGSLKFDEALGGGHPRGRIIELYGWESSGKTSYALGSASNLQKDGELIGFIDVEHAFNREYAEALGLNVDDLFFTQPDSAEQALEILDQMIESGQFALIIFDSVGALVPESELQGEMGDKSMGVVARLMSQAMRKIVGKAAKTNTTVFFINQLREKIGVMFGDPTVTTGGNSLKFYASQRLHITKSDSKANRIELDDVVIGHIMKIKVVKNKVAPPLKTASTKFYYDGGISYEDEVLDIAVSLNIVKKSGSWFSYGETKLGQGQLSVVGMLKENPDLVDELVDKINSKIES